MEQEGLQFMLNTGRVKLVLLPRHLSSCLPNDTFMPQSVRANLDKNCLPRQCMAASSGDPNLTAVWTEVGYLEGTYVRMNWYIWQRKGLNLSNPGRF